MSFCKQPSNLESSIFPFRPSWCYAQFGVTSCIKLNVSSSFLAWKENLFKALSSSFFATGDMGGEEGQHQVLKISDKAACTYLEINNLRTEFCYLRCIFLHKPLRQASSLSFSTCGELTCAQHFFFFCILWIFFCQIYLNHHLSIFKCLNQLILILVLILGPKLKRKGYLAMKLFWQWCRQALSAGLLLKHLIQRFSEVQRGHKH